MPKEDVPDDKKVEEAKKDQNTEENQKKKKGAKVVLKKPAGMPPKIDMDKVREKKDIVVPGRKAWTDLSG